MDLIAQPVEGYDASHRCTNTGNTVFAPKPLEMYVLDPDWIQKKNIHIVTHTQ